MEMVEIAQGLSYEEKNPKGRENRFVNFTLPISVYLRPVTLRSFG
jgi:hypothetical protein